MPGAVDQPGLVRNRLQFVSLAEKCSSAASNCIRPTMPISRPPRTTSTWEI